MAEVLGVLADVRALPRWWPAVYLDAAVLDGGAADGTGTTAAFRTTGWLPYTLCWTMTVTEPVTAAGYTVRAAGDLAGTGRWTFAQDGPEAVVTYLWRVRAEKPLLCRLSWLFKPAFAANHRWAMARGQESLALELRRRRAPDAAALARIPAPPRPAFARLAGVLGRLSRPVRRCP